MPQARNGRRHEDMGLAAWLCCNTGMVTAAEYTVQMLNSGPEGSMVF